MKTRTVLLFACGLVAGVALTALLITAVPRVQAAGHLASAPAGGAAGAVSRVKSEGIMRNEADGQFHGNQPVTRFEAAVVLDRFVQYVEQGRKPLHDTSIHVPVSKASAPVGSEAHQAQMALMDGRFLPTDSVLFKAPGTQPVTADQFADALSHTVNRVVDRSLPKTPNTNPED